jgi:hypothetical protein
MTQQPHRTTATGWGFTHIQRPKQDASPFSPPQSIFAPTRHARPEAYLTPLCEERKSIHDDSMSGLMYAMSQWEVTTPETVRGVPDPVPTASLLFSHRPPTQCKGRSIDSHFTSQKPNSCSGASQEMRESCGGTCRYESMDASMVDDEDDEKEPGEHMSGSCDSMQGDAYAERMSLGD